MFSYGCFTITPLLSTVYAPLLISMHINCTDHSGIHYLVLQIMAKITANRAILTKLWPSDFDIAMASSNIEFSWAITFFMLASEHYFLSIFVDWDLLYHR